MNKETNLVREVRRQAMKTLLADPELNFDRAMYSINPLLESGEGPVRTRQAISFLAEIVLQTTDGAFSEALVAEAQEGFGWILRICADALEAQEDIEEAQRIASNVTKLEVGS